MARFDVPVGDEILTVDAVDAEQAKAAAKANTGKEPGEPVPLDQSVAQPSTPTGLPPLARDAATALTAPARGMRGVGVGLEHLASDIPLHALVPTMPMSPQEVQQAAGNAPQALERAAAAVQPDYVAQEGEKLGAFAGETVGSLPLAYATGGGAGVNAMLRVKMALGAVSAGTMSAIDQASKRGDVHLIDTGLSAGAGGLIPIVGPTMQAIGKMFFGLGPMVAAKVGVKPYAIEELRADPMLLKNVEGSAEAVGQKVVGIQKALKGVYDAASSNLRKVRAKYNLPSFFEDGKVTDEALAAIEEGKFEPDAPDALVGRFRFLSKNKGMSPEAKIRSLVELRDKIRLTTTYGRQGVGENVKPIGDQESSILKGMTNDINKMIWDTDTKKGIPGGQTFRKAEATYSESRNIYDNLQKKLVDEATGEATLARIAYNDNIDEIIGKDSAVDNMIKWLEDQTGKPLLKPLRKELASKAIKEMRPPGALPPLERPGFSGSSVGNMIYGTGPTGLQNTIKTLDTVGQGSQAIGQALTTPIGRIALQAGRRSVPGGKK